MKSGLRNIIFFIICLQPVFSVAQNFRSSQDKIYLSLIEDVHILTLFVDTEDDYWEDDEKEYYQKELEKCQNWLVKNAADYNQELTFQNETFPDNNAHIYIKQVNRGRPVQLIQLVMEELDYADIETFFADNRFEFSENKFKILLLVKNNSRSHAYNLWSKNDVDIAIVYCRNSYGIRTDQYVIAHELLHQFGAWDLYAGESQSSEKAAIALERYPNSVMISTYGNKESLNVDHLTAYLIGWHNQFEKSFNDFMPVRTR